MSDFGRSEVARVLGAAVVPQASGGRVVAVTGPAGIGKTTLLSGITEAVAVEGVRVVAAAAFDAGAHQPFAAIWPLLQPEGVPATTGPLVLPADPVTAAVARVDEWCGQGPVVVWVDDAQHLDAGSATVLTRLARATSDLPLTILLSARWWPSRPELSVLSGLATLSVEIPALEPPEVAQLVRARTGRPPGPRLTEQLGAAAGNPLALTILVDLLSQSGAARPEGDVVEVRPGDQTLPQAATTAARAQLQTLPSGTRELATTVAVLGPPADVEDVAEVMGRPLAALLDDLQPAHQAGVLRWANERLVFGHDAYRDALVDDLPAPLRQAIHRRAVRVLRQRGAPDQQVAEHILRGGVKEHSGLVRDLAATLTDTAPGIAADLLAQLQPLISPEDTEEVILARAEMLFLSGRPQECDDLIRTYLPRVTSPETGMRLQRLSLSALDVQARVGAVLGQVENLLQQPKLPAEWRREMLLQRAHVLLNGGQLSAVEEACRQIRAQYDDFADDVLVLDEAAIALLHGRAADAERVVAHVVAAGAGSEALQSRGHLWQAMTASFAHSPVVARQRAAEARSFSASYAARWMLPYHDAVLGAVCFDAGWWDDAVAVLDAGLELADETGSGWMASASGLRALVDLHRGDPAAARRRLDALAQRGLPTLFGLDIAAQAHLLLLELEAVDRWIDTPNKDWSSAHQETGRRAAELWGQARDRSSELWQARIALDVLRTADRRVRHDLADAMTAWSTGQMPGWDPVRDLVLALTAQDLPGAVIGAEALTAAGNALAAAQAWEETGILAAQTAHPTRARTALRQALDGYTALGASTDIRRLRARANRAGIRIAAPAAQPRPSFGWESLTPTEQTVARYVHTGLTNPQIAATLFLSPRTVQTHVSAILRKTGLHTRLEIATQVGSNIRAAPIS